MRIFKTNSTIDNGECFAEVGIFFNPNEYLDQGKIERIYEVFEAAMTTCRIMASRDTEQSERNQLAPAEQIAVGPEVVEDQVKPKRIRRTKAEMEAARAALANPPATAPSQSVAETEAPASRVRQRAANPTTAEPVAANSMTTADPSTPSSAAQPVGRTRTRNQTATGPSATVSPPQNAPAASISDTDLLLAASNAATTITSVGVRGILAAMGYTRVNDIPANERQTFIDTLHGAVEQEKVRT